ncbi:MAG: hypothetical protein Q4C91_22520 [Eubacteriales bacterium]|nr:hypothetical protein [Eubacteriales bacterium]
MKIKRKKEVLFAAGLLAMLSCGFVYANEKDFLWKEFFNSEGEVAYYPISESIPKTPIDSMTKYSDDISAPETAKIGDVFLGEDGYERVIAVSKDGAYVTEILPPEESNNR